MARHLCPTDTEPRRGRKVSFDDTRASIDRDGSGAEVAARAMDNKAKVDCVGGMGHDRHPVLRVAKEI